MTIQYDARSSGSGAALTQDGHPIENTKEKTLETMKYDIENKATTRPLSNGAHSLIKDVQQEQKGAETNNIKLDSKSPVMKANSEVSKEMESEEDGRMRNENSTLSTRTRVTKKQNRFNNCVI